ncbi:MAG: glutathione S-transferase family protein [Proteobacteria bacterium]|nr:glutathione S-transferase family protein [Pseudomonadota bacterium]
MKLFFSHASPFARKCRIAIRLKSLLSQTDEIEATPLQNPPELLAANPIAQVPSLILENGIAVSNSPLICAYIDKIGTGKSIYGSDELAIRRLENLGDAIMETAVKIRLEQLRPEGEKSPSWIKRWQDNLERTLIFAEKEVNNIDLNQLNIGNISIVCALSYLDLRFPEYEWKNKYKNLKQIQCLLEETLVFKDTFPK